MLPPVVLIEFDAEPSAEAADLLTQRCSEVVASSGTGGCELASAASASGEAPLPPWVARVRWLGAPMYSAQIRLYRSADLEEPVRRRELHFAADSPELDRWESVGLLVAALVVSSRSEPRVAPEEPQQEPVEPLVAPTPTQVSTTRGHLGIAGAVGSALSSDTFQIGASLLGQLQLPEAALRPRAQLAFAHASDTPALDSGALSLGLGIPFGEPPAELEFYAELLGQLLQASASDGAASESATVFRWGGVAGLGVFPRLNHSLSLWLAGEALLLSPKVTFEVEDQPAGDLGALAWRGFFGLRWTP